MTDEQSITRLLENWRAGDEDAFAELAPVVSFMHYDLGYFDHETCRLEPIDNPFAAKVLPMSPE